MPYKRRSAGKGRAPELGLTKSKFSHIRWRKVGSPSGKRALSGKVVKPVGEDPRDLLP